MQLCDTCVEAGRGRRDAEVELEILRQEGRVTGQREREAEADHQREVHRIGQQAPT